MLNEWQEFLDYTGPVCYQAVGKRDTTWLGRFTFEALRDFSGLARILTILARGFLFHTPGSSAADWRRPARVSAPGAASRRSQTAGKRGSTTPDSRSSMESSQS